MFANYIACETRNLLCASNNKKYNSFIILDKCKGPAFDVNQLHATSILENICYTILHRNISHNTSLQYIFRTCYLDVIEHLLNCMYAGNVQVK